MPEGDEEELEGEGKGAFVQLSGRKLINVCFLADDEEEDVEGEGEVDEEEEDA